MSDLKDQKLTNHYLDSPLSFHLEMPLYSEFDLSDEEIANKIYKLLTYRDTIDAHCVWCTKEGVFKASDYFYDSITIPSWTTRNNGLIKIEYQCTRDNSHVYHIYFFKEENFFTKAGQFPSVADFQIPQAQKYHAILKNDQYKDFTRGIGLAAHGVGIGSFVYLRRVFENLIEEAFKQARSNDAKFNIESYTRAKMDEKIKILKDFLPDFLVDNRRLYLILSKGIHDLSEEECLQYFETVKIGIEQILDEKIVQSERLQKAERARKSIQKALGKLT